MGSVSVTPTSETDMSAALALLAAASDPQKTQQRLAEMVAREKAAKLAEEGLIRRSEALGNLKKRPQN
jgi:hypothetical protein